MSSRAAAACAWRAPSNHRATSLYTLYTIAINRESGVGSRRIDIVAVRRMRILIMNPGSTG